MTAARKGSSSLKWDRVRTKELFTRYRENKDPAIREELIRSYLNLVEYLARRFKNRGEPLDDLIQVGTIGLIKAIDRYDIDRVVEFTTYATPTIVGELKRHFRDKGWAIRVPRRLQELNLQINARIGGLTQELGRSPTIEEIAKALGATKEEIAEAIETGEAYNTISLNSTTVQDGDDRSFSLMDYLGEDDKILEATEDRTSLVNAMQVLNGRERGIIYLRFFKGMTQTEIARQLGISQMHVSRLLRKTLDTLRKQIKE